MSIAISWICDLLLIAWRDLACQPIICVLYDGRCFLSHSKRDILSRRQKGVRACIKNVSVVPAPFSYTTDEPLGQMLAS